MKSPAVPAKRRGGGSGARLALVGCGCKDSKSVSVSVSASASPSATTTGTSTVTTRRRSANGLNPWASTTTDTLTSASSSSLWEDSLERLGYKDGGCRMLPETESSVATPSFSGLLRELSELERSVASWGAARKEHHCKDKLSPSPAQAPALLPLRQEHRRAKAGELVRDDAKEDRLFVDAADGGDAGAGSAGLDGIVAVVKRSDDPLRDFRRSMLQMIVENGIVAGEDLREMLRRFLTLNAPHHHDAILRAFAEIWDDVFIAAASLDCASPARRASSVSRRELPGMPPAPRTPSHHHRRSPPAWRV